MEKAFKLIEITETGEPAVEIPDLPETAVEILQATAGLYDLNGYSPPWIGYLALQGNRCVGTCGFKSVPKRNRVEIAYHTFVEFEGLGFATRMAHSLVEIASREMPGIRVIAQTLPSDSASTTVLRKNGFRLIGEVDHPENGKVWEWHLLK